MPTIRTGYPQDNMNLIDRSLLILASACLSLISIIILSGELNSRYTSPKPKIQKVDEDRVSDKKNDQMIIYSQEIEEAIKTYFRELKKSPEIDEEEKRLVDEVFSEKANTLKNISDVEPPKEIESSKKKPGKENKNYIQYTVKKGESLWRLSNKFNVPLYTIISANPHKSNQIIHPGDRLKIPTRKGLFYKVKKGDSLFRIAKEYKTNIRHIWKINNLASSRLRIGQTLFLPDVKPKPRLRYRYIRRFIWPIKGKITSGYGWRKHPLYKKKHFHEGIDIGAKKGTNIRAVAKGVVIHANKSGGYGKLIILRHKDGYISAYAHCLKIFARKGQLIRKGQVIASVGSSGTSTGSHLHFEIKHRKKRINPIVALRKKVRVPVPFG